MGLPLLCVLGSIVLYLALSYFLPSDTKTRSINSLERDSYGGMDKQVPVMVKGFTDEPIKTFVEIQPREYTQEEVKTVFELVIEGMEKWILVDNSSLMEIRSDLNLITRLEPEGIRLRWQSDIPDFLNNLGQVTNEAAGAEGEKGQLRVQLSDGVHKADYEIPICVYPPLYSRQEQLLNQFAQELKRLDLEQKEQPQLTLPGEYEGHSLQYSLEGSEDYKAIPLIGAFMAILLALRSRQQEQQRQKEREQQMLLDYSEVISKLMVFLGAGMTVRLSWERIVKDYIMAIEAGKQSHRYVYEEMCNTYHQLQSGVSEGRAYQEFGERCRLQPYLKLSSLLEQNRKTGTKNLRELMRKEMEDAFEQRKNLVRRLGEEASTKLAAPLFLMLGVIMVLVLFPAMMSMQ